MAIAESIRRRRRIVLAAALVVVVALVVVIVLATRGGDSGPPIADGAAKLVPSDALVYVNVSTDGDRAAVRHAQQLGDGFPSYKRLRDAVLKRLAVGSDGAGVSSWLGDEAALALTGSGGETAGSLVLLSVRDRAAARRYVAAGAKQSGPSTSYRGVRLDRFGALYAAFVGDFLVLGQQRTIDAAIDLHQGRGRSLAADPTYAATTGGLPTGRVADAYATSDGLGRLLVPAGGVLGVAGLLLDRPNLQGVAAALSASGPGAEVVVRSKVPGRKADAFQPSLTGDVPKGAMAYYATRGLDQNITRLLAAAGTSNLADLLTKARTALGSAGVKAIQGDLLNLLTQESAVAILPGIPAPTLLIIAHTKDAARTQQALKRLDTTLPKLLKGATVSAKAGVTTIKSGSSEFDLAVIDDKLVISTGMRGIDAARHPDGGLDDSDAYQAVVGTPDGAVTSLVFLDFGQLLRLAEQTGLNDSRAYLAVKGDLSRVRSVGATSTGGGTDPVTEIRVQIG